MSWWSNVKRWFWGDLKPELQDEPVEKEQPKEITTTDKVLEEAVEVLDEAIKKTLEKTPDVKSKPEPKKQRVPRKRKPKVSEETKETEVKKAPKKRATKKPAEKPATKKPRKPRKKKESNAD